MTMENSTSFGSSKNNTHGLMMFTWRFKEVAQYLTISTFIFCLILMKILHSKVHFLSRLIPESLLLLLTGSIFGVIIRFLIHNHLNLILTPEVFFYILLPPIILDASFGLATRSFVSVIHLVIILAIFGTLFNFFIIGGLLSLAYKNGFIVITSAATNIQSTLWLFASIIVAVDPVAILAIFNDIGVKPELYFTLFGESLLNDGVTVVLYNLVSYLIGFDGLTATSYLLGMCSFMSISLGGMIVGTLFGVLSCFLTRLRTSYEGLVIMVLGYLSYIVADLVGWSGIMSIMACGLMQACYAFQNMRADSLLVLRTTVANWCSLSEGIIFLFLGEKLVHMLRGWNTRFIVWTVLCCLVTRFVVVFAIFAIIQFISRSKVYMLTWKDQLILANSGLRGAVAFSLVVLIDKDQISNDVYDMLVSAILFEILFSMVFQGLTMKLLVWLLRVNQITTDKMSLFYTANQFAIDHTMSCIEIVCGKIGENMFREWWCRFNYKWIKPILQVNPMSADEKILRVMERISLTGHLNYKLCICQPSAKTTVLEEEVVQSHRSQASKMDMAEEEIFGEQNQTSEKKRPHASVKRMFTSLLENQRAATMIRHRLNKDPSGFVEDINSMHAVRSLSLNYTSSRKPRMRPTVTQQQPKDNQEIQEPINVVDSVQSQITEM